MGATELGISQVVKVEKKGKRSKQVEPTPRRSRTQQRRFEGAQYNRLVSDWIMGSMNRSLDADLWSDLSKLRSRSRDLVQNSDHARGAVLSIVNSVLGDYGFRLQAKVKFGSGKLNKTINKEIEAQWRLWAGDPKRCHAAGKLTFRGIERVVLRGVIESGEILIRKVPQRFGRSKIPFALELIESDQLADDKTILRAENGNEIRMGVEIDKWQRPVAYHLKDRHPGDLVGAQGSSYKIQRVPADEIIHLYVTERPNQSRGYPWLSASLTRVKNLSDYEQALLIKKKAQACISGVITTPVPEEVGVPVSSDEGANEPPPPNQMSMEPGVLKVLGPGEHIEGFNPGGTDQEAESIVKHMLRSISAGLGVGYSTIAHDYADASYSSHRAEKLNELTTLRAIQQWLIESCHNEIYQEWLEMAVMSGAVNLPQFEQKRDMYSASMFMAAGFAWIDPAKDIAAHKEGIRGGLTTPSIALAEAGYDVEEIFEQLQSDKELAESYGLILDVFMPKQEKPQTESTDVKEIKRSLEALESRIESFLVRNLQSEEQENADAA